MKKRIKCDGSKFNASIDIEMENLLSIEHFTIWTHFNFVSMNIPNEWIFNVAITVILIYLSMKKQRNYVILL